MANPLHPMLQDMNGDDLTDYLDMRADPLSHPTDDSLFAPDINRCMEQMLEAIARVGGEVCKLRSEVDELLDQNQTIHESFRKLKDVISEKGLLDLDEFQLACDVFDESQTRNNVPSFLKKTTH